MVTNPYAEGYVLIGYVPASLAPRILEAMIVLRPGSGAIHCDSPLVPSSIWAIRPYGLGRILKRWQSMIIKVRRAEARAGVSGVKTIRRPRQGSL